MRAQSSSWSEPPRNDDVHRAYRSQDDPGSPIQAFRGRNGTTAIGVKWTKTFAISSATS